MLVVGGGFGGLSAALHLAADGASVLLCEALSYPGGCASSLDKGGARYDTGATLLSGFGPGQWMAGWKERFGLDVELDLLDPVLTYAGSVTLTVGADRHAFVEQLCALPGAPVEGIRRFFRLQRRIADTLWPVLDDPALLPPLSAASLLRHVPRALGYAGLAPWVGRPVRDALVSCGVERFAPLVEWVDAACLITVQVPSDQAEATYGLSAIDLYFRGAAHVRGGIGVLASATARCIEQAGGVVSLANRVKRIERVGDAWSVSTRKGVVQARHVVANVLPQALEDLAGVSMPRVAGEVAKGWGATMLYVLVEDDGLPAHGFHRQCVADPAEPLPGGNHVLLSVAERGADRAPDGLRAATVSAHAELCPIDVMRGVVERNQARMRATLALRAPDLTVAHELPASPRTWQRFTRRHRGLVGGVPRRAGWSNYRDLWPTEPARNLWLAGDSTFPGQSVLAVAIGGQRIAEAIRRRG